MKSIALIITLFLCVGCAGQVSQEESTEFLIETAAILLAVEVKDSFEWDENTQRYYDLIMTGNLSLEGARIVEGYFAERYNPILVNRLTTLASMAGFDLNAAGSIAGVENVDMTLLQAAARGFKMGLELN